LTRILIFYLEGLVVMHPSRSEQLYRLNKRVSNLCQWLFCFLAAMCVVNPTHEVFIHLALAALSAGILVLATQFLYGVFWKRTE